MKERERAPGQLCYTEKYSNPTIPPFLASELLVEVLRHYKNTTCFLSDCLDDAWNKNKLILTHTHTSNG